VHSGDFTLNGTDEEYAQFDGWLRAVTHQYHYRIVVLGMRDVRRYGADWDVMKALLPHATHVLCHEDATVMGIKFYGCPWNWGHDFDYGIRSVAPASTSGAFDRIPDNTSVLVTHGAPYGALDATGFDKSLAHHGSRELTEVVQRRRPGVHLHGHVDAGRGVAPAFSSHPLTLNSCCCDDEQGVLYATAQVIRGAKLMSEGEDSTWSFSLAPLET
jgi:Icc-related predicted phosphoesterase